jgi:hypothetical protein
VQCPASNGDAILDAVVGLTGDITDVRRGADLRRLRALAAAAARSQVGEAAESRVVPRPTSRLMAAEYDDDVREALRAELLSADAPDLADAGVLEVQRRDGRELLLEGRLVDSLSGLSPSERLGPFVVSGGAEIWFDLFFFARRVTVIEAASSLPAFVFTKARPPETAGGHTTVDIEAGTVWIRGDLLDGGLPSSAFVGIRVQGGSLELDSVATLDGDTVQLTSSVRGHLLLDLEEDSVVPAPEGCSSSASGVDLPDRLRFHFHSGSTYVEGSAGQARAWGQTFDFAESTGAWTFIEPLWTIVLGYGIVPEKLDTNAIPNDLVDFDGTAPIAGGGLGLPVVVASNPGILGEAARSADWWLKAREFSSRWYEPERRGHEISEAWVGISDRGTLILAEDVPPLSPPVTHSYALWSIADGGGQRVPWQQEYQEPFVFVHRCDIVEGEQLLVTGQSHVVLDRPVQVGGEPIATPTDKSVLSLHRLAGRVTVTLGATVEPTGDIQRIALRNALLWTTLPAVLFVQGELTGPGSVTSGSAHLFMGVFAWVPTLPDPYVTNFLIRQGAIDQGSQAKSLLVAQVSWRTPDDISVSFEGQLGLSIALAGRDRSAGNPKPAPTHKGSPDVGPTQVSVNSLYLGEESEAQRKGAQGAEQKGRPQRVKTAHGENARSRQIVDGYLAEVLGSTPQALLLDVSTNQDLLGIALGVSARQQLATHAASTALSPGAFPVARLAMHAQVGNMRVVALPQVQWEPVRTLDSDQDILTLGWFPTPLASASDGGATQLGARSQRLVPAIPEDTLRGTFEAYSDGTPVAFRTTLPFGLVAAVQLEPNQAGPRKPDTYELVRPEFPSVNSVGGYHVTAQAEGGRPDLGGVSPMFAGRMRQLINGVDLASGTPLGLSVLGSTADPGGSVETVFNNDMTANARVPVTRFDLSGYGGSNFSEWNNPFAAFAEAAKVQFRVMVGRTALEVIKVNTVLHPWGIRVTRSVTVERRPGGGVIRRDSGWQAFTPGLFDYRYFDTSTSGIEVAQYEFDSGVFRGLFNIRSIRPAPGSPFSSGGATMIPYYFDADAALDGMEGRTPTIGVLGYLQTQPNGEPASVAALQNLLQAQGPIGGPIDAWIDFGGSGLPYRARRIEIGLAMNGADPIFVATVRGVPKLPRTGAWSVVTRQTAGVPLGGGEASFIPDSGGVPLIRRYPVRYNAGDTSAYGEPPLDGPPSSAGDYRFADARDLLTPSTPASEYALLQSTPTHAFLFPRPYVPGAGGPKIHSDVKSALADVIARSTSKGAFPPPENTIELGAGSLYFTVGSGGTLALSSPISVVNHPTPLRIAGSAGHGSVLTYEDATLELDLGHDQWSAEFSGLKIWTDLVGLERLTGSEMRIVGSTWQRPQVAELRSLILQEVEEILQYIPLFGMRGVQGPIELGASNAVHELKLEVKVGVEIPPLVDLSPIAGLDLSLKLYIKQSTGFDLATGGIEASAAFGASLEGKVPVLSVGAASVFIIISLEIEFGLTSVSGLVTEEGLELLAFVGVGVEGKIGPFKAYAFLGVGFVLVYDAIADVTKYGGLVALEAGVDLKIVEVKIRAELQGLVYEDTGTTMVDYSGKVEIEVNIFLIISISASYQITETQAF